MGENHVAFVWFYQERLGSRSVLGFAKKAGYVMACRMQDLVNANPVKPLQHSLYKLWCNLTVFAILFCIPLQASLATDRCQTWAAKIVSVQGQVEFSFSQRTHWQTVRLEQTICVGDKLVVGARSRAAILLPDETILRLDEGTTITFTRVETERPSLIELVKGAVHFISRVPNRLDVKTPFVSAGTEGTEYVLRVGPSQTLLWVFEGRVTFKNAFGSLRLTHGESAVAEAGKPPKRRVEVRPRDAVHWALYYPPLIDYRDASYPTAARAQGIWETLRHYRKGNSTAAFASLDRVPKRMRGASYFTLRAGLFLSVGRVAEARADIDRSLTMDPENSTAYALQSVVAVAHNEVQQALSLARKALELDPQSPIPKVALSYGYQATYDIERALDSILQALELGPTDALIYARLAELYLSLGDLDKAVSAARTAVALDPDLARTHSVLGFAYLTQIDINKAEDAFEKAIALDPASPLPRLGLGLAKFRQGELAAGTEQIEIAASLDPNNSLIRSYLGKAYFEQRRAGSASVEFDMAKELDPNDPTPWFYDAIHKQTTNRPVEALHDLEKAMELNDNRAVYRSRLLLDQDQATRSTSLARIYEDLGFEQLGLVQAAKSLSLDPSNYSAHRFLSDTYARLPRHKIARRSELLQAQLLQPINVNPVQPQFTVTDLGVLPRAGPAEASFNEFSPLFETEKPQLLVSGIIGDNDTVGDETVLSGLYGKLSYSLGQFHLESDGFRENNDVEHDIFNTYAQIALTPKLNLQAEFNRRITDQGELRLAFDVDDFDPGARSNARESSARLGGRYAISPYSDVIVSLIGIQFKARLDRIRETGTQISRVDEDAYQIEGQYLFQGNRFNITAGLGGFSNDIDRRRVVGSSPTMAFDTEVDQENAYLYTTTFIPRKLAWTIGIGYDGLKRDGPTIERSRIQRWNPKFGLQWDATDRLRVRLAAFRTLKRGVLVNQTIEPTQIAGFNQFFDDPSATRAWRYGVGLDARFTDDLYGGFELSRRELEIPSEDLLLNLDEDVFRSYLYWTPHSNWAFSAEYRFDKFQQDQDGRGFPEELQTLRLPLMARYFDPSGWFAEFGTIYVHQDVDRFPESTSASGIEDFVVLDAAVGYRLPKRRGILSVETTNLLDEDLMFQDEALVFSSLPESTDRFIPDRSVIFRAIFSF